MWDRERKYIVCSHPLKFSIIFNYFDILKLKVKKKVKNRFSFTLVVIEYRRKLSLQSLAPVGYGYLLPKVVEDI